MPRRSVFLLVLSSTIGFSLALAERVQAAGDDGVALFEQKIRPVLEGTCVKCHGAAKTSGGLRLDTRGGYPGRGRHGTRRRAR